MSTNFRTMLHTNSLLEVQMIRAVFETHGVKMQVVEGEDSYEVRVLEDTFDRAYGILTDRGILGGEEDDAEAEDEEVPEVEFSSGQVTLPEARYDAPLEPPRRHPGNLFVRLWSRLRGRWNRL